MLSEHFAASISAAAVAPKAAPNSVKDVGISVFESQPHSGQRASFKKSNTTANCLAVSPSHIFAAQADKAVVNVYNREKGNQEATVPFQERITCLALACEDTVLVLGSQTGRIFVWETHTGRVVITSQAHLQQVTALVVDPTSNFVLSASADASIHVWSLPALLSFTNAALQGQHSPLHTLSGHRAAITSLVVGHSAGFCNIAVSASADQSCIVWDYHENQLLRTVLLPAIPRCLTLDPADRAFYTAYDDGSVQVVDFYSEAFSAANPDSVQHPLYDQAQAAMPVQPPQQTRWTPPSADQGAALSAMLSYDGSMLMTGHSNGNVLVWDVPLGRYSSTFTSIPMMGPVTNLVPLPVQGFPDTRPALISQAAIVKPKHAAFDKADLDGAIPGNYNLSLQFSRQLPMPHISASKKQAAVIESDFLTALTHPVFPESLLADSLAELASWNGSAKPQPIVPSAAAPVASTAQVEVPAAQQQVSDSADFMSLDAPESASGPTIEQQNEALRAELAALKRVQRASLVQMESLRKEKVELLAKIRQDIGDDMEDEVNEDEKSERAWGRLAATGEYLESEEESE
ncbi:WD40 repeat-like protein [Aureobasidium subglaciale]|nr:WD40 repeat-like protein [Aureobasidium subglaciale]